MWERSQMIFWWEILWMLFLILISGHTVEMAILFGSFCLVRSQAGGFEWNGIPQKILFLTVLWGAGMLCLGWRCPHWFVYLSLVLVNLILFLFAPATNRDVKNWSEEQRSLLKKKTMFISFLLSLCVLCTQGKVVCTIILLTLLIEAGLVFYILFQAVFGSE